MHVIYGQRDVISRRPPRFPVPPVVSVPLPSDPAALAERLARDEADPVGAAAQLGAVAEDLGDDRMRKLAGEAGKILLNRGNRQIA